MLQGCLCATLLPSTPDHKNFTPENSCEADDVHCAQLAHIWTNTFCYLDKYILLFGQIRLVFGQLHFVIWNE